MGLLKKFYAAKARKATATATHACGLKATVKDVANVADETAESLIAALQCEDVVISHNRKGAQKGAGTSVKKEEFADDEQRDAIVEGIVREEEA